MARSSIAALLLISVSVAIAVPALAEEPYPPADEIVTAAIELWRSGGSWARLTMTIHRPTFERSMTLESWTRGVKDALTRFTDPPKDAGNAVLKLGEEMWMFTPKLNQVMKLPSSMMGQSWMGSEFSYDDLAKSDRLVVDYDLTVTGRDSHEGQVVYLIEALPRDDAPVVWGKQTLRVRADSILLEQVFFDQDFVPLRTMSTESIEVLDGRLYPVLMRMTSLEKEDSWTELAYSDARFDIELPNSLFSRSSLQNPRPWKPSD